MDIQNFYIFYKGEIVGAVTVRYDGCIGSIEIDDAQLKEIRRETHRVKKEMTECLNQSLRT